MTTFNLYAYSKDDDHTEDRRDGVPAHRITDALTWALAKGHDTILIERAQGVSTPGVTSHGCNDSRCPGGCTNSQRTLV